MTLSDKSLTILNHWFEKNSYATREQKKVLAEKAHITVSQVSKWLAGQRAKKKKNQGKQLLPKKISKERKLLQKFFEKKNKPNKNEIFELSKQTGKHAKKFQNGLLLKGLKIKNN